MRMFEIGLVLALSVAGAADAREARSPFGEDDVTVPVTTQQTPADAVQPSAGEPRAPAAVSPQPPTPSAKAASRKTEQPPSPPLKGTTAEIIGYYEKLYPGDPERAWEESLADRNRLDPRNIPLRDAEHYFWAKHQVQDSPWPFRGYRWLQEVICTYGYTGYKAVRGIVRENTTPPSAREIFWGLQGAYDGLKGAPPKRP